MSNKNKKTLSPAQKQFQNFANAREPKRPIFLNCVKSFIAGGLICTLGQAVQWIFINYFGFSEETASNPTVAVLIILSILLTSIGIYDHISQWAGAGTAVPVTGFANTMASAALEHKSEGYVFGVGGNMFKLAGPVIVYGVFSSFVVAIIKITIEAISHL